MGAHAALAAALVSPHSLTGDTYFEANKVQADPSVAFVAKGPGYAVLLQSNGSADYRFPAGLSGDAQPPLGIEFAGQRAPAAVAGEEPLAGVTNYYSGSRSADWYSGIPHYRRVRFAGVYPGIDLMWRSRGADLEYEFLVAAGADPRNIRVRFRGVSRFLIDEQGDLELETPGGKIRHRKPVAWQDVAGVRRDVRIEFSLRGATAAFRLGEYDRQRPLWIDPVVCWSSYLGGAGYDAGYAIAADGSGGVYLTGTTSSIGFPGPGQGVNSNNNVFVMKFDESGDLLYKTVLSTNGNTSGQAIAADSSGDAYIAGTTEASNFPATAGAWQTVFGGGSDAFAAKLDPTGKLVYATYVGGTGADAGTGIAIDSFGNAYVSGYTSSLFPTTPGAAQTLYGGGFADAFVIKLNAQASTAVYSTLLGGTGTDEAEAITVDAYGNACIAGYTDSSNLPVYAALQPSPGGEGDALIACLNAAGTAWTMVSYLGGSSLDQAFALASDTSGNLYVAGTTYSEDFPITPGVLQSAKSGGYDAFLAKLSPGGATILYVTYLGGNGSDAATTMAVGSAGDVWIGGYTTSTNFPLSGAWQSVPGGSFDGFISHINPAATTLVTSSYLGGSADDRVWGIALDPETGTVFANGATLSTNFPVTPGAMQPGASAGMNAFLVNINPSGYALYGHVTTQAGTPLSGVEISLGGASIGSVSTDGNGNFSFNNLAGGNSYTVTPALNGYSFSPPALALGSVNANQTANFTATAAYSISGNITLTGAGPLQGVIVMLSGAVNSAAATDVNGNYSFTGLLTGTYTIAPSLKGYVFSPVNQVFSSLSSDQTANFTASPSVFPGQTAVVWQDPVSGFSQSWFIGGAQGTSFVEAATITTQNTWRIAAIADFNGDGYPDIVWQNSANGGSQIWFMTGPYGTTLLEAATFSGPNPWRIVAANDFNRDGHPDLVWQAPGSGWAQIWYLGGPQGISVLNAANLTLKNPWNIVGSGDFNGDGVPDLLWQDPVSGWVQIWYLTGSLGNQLLSATNLCKSATQAVAVADFNQDGHPDIVWQDSVSGASQIELLNGPLGTTPLQTVTLSGTNPWSIVGPR